MMKRMEERIMKQINCLEDKIDILMKRMEPQCVIEREGKDPDQSDSPDAKRFQEMLQKASEEMDATMRDINETEDSSGKSGRNETVAENERQGIKVTQEENEGRQDNRGKVEDRNKADAKEVADSDEEDKSIDSEEYSENGDNAKQAPQAREKEVGREPSDEEYSDSSDDISDKIENQERKG